MSDWHLVYTAYEPGQERLREALCTTGNGYFATRGAAPESVSGEHHYPGTYVAGCYNRLGTEIAGRTIVNECLVNLPNWLALDFAIGDGTWFDLEQVEILSYRQSLEMERGILRREIDFRDASGNETRLEQWRLVHMRRIHLAVLHMRLVPRNWSGTLRIRSAIDGRVANEGVARYRELSSHHLIHEETRVIDTSCVALSVRTNDSDIVIAQAARTRLFRQDEALDTAPRIVEKDSYIAQEFRLDLERHEPLCVEKTLALFTSRDTAIYRPDIEARKAVAHAPRAATLSAEQMQAWEQLWHRFSFRLEHTDTSENDRILRILRLHIFQLLQTSSPATMDLDVSVPARGLHGEAYRGHIFWDELFIFPILNLRMPSITCALLMYRFRRLDEARQAARQAGYKGAMYPWQSGSNGREESQRLHLNPRSGRWIPDNSWLQRHVNSAIAFNAWQYYEVTADREFLTRAGAEMILEIARFWSSIAVFTDARGRYEICGVMGPDEYHDAYPGSESGGLDNNAYTNVMAVWVFRRALQLPDVLGEQRWKELCAQLGLDQEEIERWRELCRKMYIPFHDDGIISQFEGYEQLREFDWEAYESQYGDIQRLDRILEAEGDHPNRYKVSKQADVVMLFYLLSAEELRAMLEDLGYAWSHDLIPRNIDYYMRRTSHGSTLSRVVHSWVLSRANREGAWRLFCEALKSDVEDIQGGTTSEGIHTGAMAGTIDLLQRCFTGIETRGDTLQLNPCLPEKLARLGLHLRYRGHVLTLDITHAHLLISSEEGAAGPVRISIRDEETTLAPGESREVPLKPHCSAPARGQAES